MARGLCLILISLAGLFASVAHYVSVLNHIRSARHEFNSTSERCESDLLVFNRVPKVGSQTILNLIGALRRKNNFKAFTAIDSMPTDMDRETTYIPHPEHRRLTVEAIVREKRKHNAMVFLKHQNFLSFEEFEQPSPVYMNFVRDPVERLISWYYYVRAPWYHLVEDKSRNGTVMFNGPHLSLREIKTSMEECFRSTGRECSLRQGMSVHGDIGMPSHASQMTFFCGQGPECDRFNSEEMYGKAVQNVEKFFAVVGVLEDLDVSLQVLESYLPRYFSGAKAVLATNPAIRHVNRNIYKQEQSEEFRKMIRTRVI